jgi:hypothetical protein
MLGQETCFVKKTVSTGAISDLKPNRSEPEGFPAISRGLSEATPPETEKRDSAMTPEGSQTTAATPPGSNRHDALEPRVARRDPGLMADIPSE